MRLKSKIKGYPLELDDILKKQYHTNKTSNMTSLDVLMPVLLHYSYETNGEHQGRTIKLYLDYEGCFDITMHHPKIGRYVFTYSGDDTEKSLFKAIQEEIPIIKKGDIRYIQSNNYTKFISNKKYGYYIPKLINVYLNIDDKNFIRKLKLNNILESDFV